MNRVDDASIRGLIKAATETLGADTGRLDAEVLLASLLNKNRSHLHAWPEKILPQETLNAYRDHGQPADRLEDSLEKAGRILAQLA